MLTRMTTFVTKAQEMQGAGLGRRPSFWERGAAPKVYPLGPEPRWRQTMDTTTLLIIIIVVLLFAGGGWYGRGRWF